MLILKRVAKRVNTRDMYSGALYLWILHRILYFI